MAITFHLAVFALVVLYQSSSMCFSLWLAMIYHIANYPLTRTCFRNFFCDLMKGDEW